MNRKILSPVQAHIIADIAHLLNLCHVCANYLRIIGYYRTVIVIVALSFVQVVRHTGIKNRFDPRIQQRLDMPVYQLRREANCVRWNGCLPFQVQLAVGGRRCDNFKSQLSEKRMPKRKQLKHI